MKKILAGIIILNTLVMCQKSEIQKVQDHLNSADSLINTVNDHLKNIDSLSINLDSVSIPHIIKEKEKLEKVFDASKKSIDSLGKNIKDFNDKLESKEVQKQIDSVKSKIKNADQLKKVKERVKVIYKDRPEQETAQSQPKLDALVKSAHLEINVENLTQTRQELNHEISKFDARIQSENIVSNNEFQTMYVVAKVPLSKFDYFVDAVSNNLGTIKNKNIEIKGEDFASNQLCIVEITIIETQSAKKENKANPNASFSQKAMDAIASGGKVLGDIFLFLLPFWPIFIIAGIGFYFYKRQQKKKSKTSENTESNKQDLN